MNSSGDLQWAELHCSKDALTDVFGWFLQGILAGLAFTCLIVKRFCEPAYVRRSWETWWYDTSKQGIGAMGIHMANVYLAPLFQGDPCTWYVINFLLDSTIGLFIIFVGIRLCQYIARTRHIEQLNFGNYSAPKSWVYQTWIYVGLMGVIKLITTLFIQMDFWDNVKNFVLSPFGDQRIELVVVMLIIPFFVNIFIFWVTDNFLMRHTRKKRLQLTRPSSSSFRQSPNGGLSGNNGGVGGGGAGSSGGGGIAMGGNASVHHHLHLHLPSGSSSSLSSMLMEPSLLQRVRVKYRSMRIGAEKQNESESEALISGDDDDLLIGAKGSLGGGGIGGGGAVGVVGGGGSVMQRTTSQSIQMA